MGINKVFEIMKNHFEVTGKPTGVIGPDYWPQVREMSADDVEQGVAMFSDYLDAQREGAVG